MQIIQSFTLIDLQIRLPPFRTMLLMNHPPERAYKTRPVYCRHHVAFPRPFDTFGAWQFLSTNIKVLDINSVT